NNANELRQRRASLLNRRCMLEFRSAQCRRQNTCDDSMKQTFQKNVEDLDEEEKGLRAAERRHEELVEEQEIQQHRKMQQELWEREREETQKQYFNAKFYEEWRRTPSQQQDAETDKENKVPLSDDNRRQRRKLEVEEEHRRIFKKWWEDQLKTRQARHEKEWQDLHKAQEKARRFQEEKRRQEWEQHVRRHQQQNDRFRQSVNREQFNIPSVFPTLSANPSRFQSWCQQLDEILPEGKPVSKDLESFPDPPNRYCRQHPNKITSRSCHINTCECVIKAMLEDEYGRDSEAYAKTLRSLRNRLHPDKFSACDSATVKVKATEMTQILNNLCTK
ncbi:MAG: hypothetical protein M1831_007022, partial [Alyxoria varia]